MADLGGPVPDFVAMGDEVVACVGTRTVDLLEDAEPKVGPRLVRFDGQPRDLFATTDVGATCAGTAMDTEGRVFAAIGSSGEGGIFRVLRGVDAAPRIAQVHGVRDVAAWGGEVVVAVGVEGTTNAGLSRLPVGGAEVATPIAETLSPQRLPTKVVVETNGRITWSIASTEEILTKSSLDAAEVEILVDGRGSLPRASGLRDFAVVEEGVVVILDDLILTVPRTRPWDFTALVGRAGEARLVADEAALYVAWWADEIVERIDRASGARTILGSGIRGGTLALDGDSLWIGEARGSRLLRVRIPVGTPSSG